MPIQLNARQRQVADDLTNNILLLAGAGTGKTNTVACRVANLLTQKVAAPKEILCLTFTNRACKEMRDRISQLSDCDTESVVIRTIHGFCVWLIRNTPDGFQDLSPDFTVCDAGDCLEIIREVVFETTGKELDDRPAHILQNFIELVKDCMLAFSEFTWEQATSYAFVHRRPEIERICSAGLYEPDQKFFAFLAKYGASIIRLYNLKLLSSNMLDFADLLLRADTILSDPALIPLWEKRFRYVHVDEVQDISLAEYGLLKKLCKNAVVMFCGDFHQTIYQWRGSSPKELIAYFQSDFSPLTIEFSENYRSSGQLLAMADHFLHTAFGSPADSTFRLSQSVGGDVVTGAFETPADEVHWIYRQIAALGIDDYSRVAIITRTNKACAEVSSLLKSSSFGQEQPIRFLLTEELRMFERPEIRDMLACISLLANPYDAQSLSRVLKRLVQGVGAATVQAIVALYKQGLGVALTDFIDPRTHRDGDFFDSLLDALQKGNIVVYDVESTGTDVYNDDIIQMAAVRLDVSGKVGARYERFLTPSRPVGDSEKVHGFSDAFLRENGIAPDVALHEFLDFAEGCTVVGHNVGFDITITQQNLLRHQISRPFDNTWYDTLDLSRRFLKKLPNHKLSTVASALGAQNKPSHDAMDDILATADVLNLLCATYLLPQCEARSACYAKYLSKFARFYDALCGVRSRTYGMNGAQVCTLLSETFQPEKRASNEEEAHANLELFSNFVLEHIDPQEPLQKQLSGILEFSALSANQLDERLRQGNKVAVITAHQAKGCEFDYVFLPVLQDGVFPTYQAIKAGDLSEEKRVFYVSITRAKKKLYLSWSRFNANQYTTEPSRFLKLLD